MTISLALSKIGIIPVTTAAANNMSGRAAASLFASAQPLPFLPLLPANTNLTRV